MRGQKDVSTVLRSFVVILAARGAENNFLSVLRKVIIMSKPRGNIRTTVIASILLAGQVSAVAALRTVGARCEYHANPLGIDEARPRLSWRLASDQRGQKQSAYRILVASSPETLADNAGDLWDTGKVASDQSIHIVYRGKTLASRQRCYWKVMVWDQDARSSEWGKPAMWSMGLLDPKDWKAQWIGYDKEPEPPEPKKADIVVVKALYGVSGNRAKQIDVSAKLRKHVAAGKYAFRATNEFAGRDPADGIPKTLELEYTVNGESRTHVVKEKSAIDLLTGPSRRVGNKRYLPSPHLRKEFQVISPVKRAVIYVTAQGFAELHLNGKRVGDEFFTPGWTDYRKRIYYRTYDVTDMLRQGDNAIAGILGDGWFRGNISIKGQNQYGDKIRLLSQLHVDYADGRSETIVSDPSWKASFGPILESDMQAGETYDARREIPGWDLPGFDDSAWAAVDAGSTLQPLIQPYPGVPVRRTQELPTVKVTEPRDGKHVFDLGQNFSGWIRLKVSGEAGDKVVMRFGEMLNSDGTVHTANLRSARCTDTYILKGGGEEVWEPHFTFHGFRYVEVAGVSGKPAPEMVTGIVVHSDAPMTSSFECSNPMLNQLHSNIIWGQRSNYLEVPTDCPQRDERLGWTGDTQVFIRSGAYHQDVASFFTKWVVDVVDSVNSEGLFGNQAPVFHRHGSPAWADAGIICPWTIYKVYGDTRLIDRHYDAMARFIEACGKNGLGGLGNGPGDWLAVDSKTRKDLISTAYFAYSTRLMAEMAEVVGKKEDAHKYQALFERIRSYFQQTFVGENGVIAANSQTAYCLALHFDLLTDAQREQAAVHLVDQIKAKDYHLSVGFVGVPILLPTLTEIGRSDLAYRLIQNKTYPSWGYSVEQGATTIWERWNSYTREHGISKQRMNSFNHYAYGSCSEWMFYSMLGIDLDEAGFGTIKMKPEIGHGVTWAKGHYDSIRGRIGSDWKLEEGAFRWKVEVPANTTATLHIPASSVADITESNRAAMGATGVAFIRVEDGRVLLRVESGSYEFAVKGST